MTPLLPAGFEAEAKAWAEAGLQRELTLPDGIDFTSNDYLSLAGDDRIADAVRHAMEQGALGTPASRLLRGHSTLHEAAEREAAHWIGTERALLFASGWQANQALMTTLAGREDVLLSDSLNHASIIDGARLSRARVMVFPHGDLDALAGILADTRGARRRLIVVEDVYSMDGDRAPLAELLDLCEREDAHLILDMAHSAGLFEDGVPDHPRILARMVTGGKALGLAGAFVCAGADVIDALLNRGRSFVFSTATPPILAAALRRAIQIAMGEPERRTRVLKNADFLRQQLREGGFDAPGDGPILPIRIGEADRTMRIAAELRADGFDVRGVRPPTVPAGESRLRVVVHADHTQEQLAAFSAALLPRLDREQRRQVVERVDDSAIAGGLIVCGTDTDVGKTLVSALLMRAARQEGIPSSYLKPVQTGRDSDTDRVVELAELPPESVASPIVSLPLPASVDQAAEQAGTEVHARELLDGIRTVMDSRRSHRWVLESAGGLRVPLNTKEEQIDVLQALRLPVVLVARSSLGTLNHTLLTLEALRHRGMSVKALFLVGQPHPQNVASLRARVGDLPILEVPLFREVCVDNLDFWLASEPRVTKCLL